MEAGPANQAIIARATVDDAEILALIKRAFAPVARQYGVPSLPPLDETLAEHLARYEDSVVFKATYDGAIVGSVQGRLDSDGVCHVARLVVDPAFQRRGIGRALMVALERSLPQARRFELFTGHQSEETIRLYRSLGYQETRRQRQSDALTLVWLEKARTAGTEGP
ncbi:MAG: GNAT family N-acetyltransferase [Anaerosomatales bacterium]|nr:GNAT family N-acetyltransferase [Anaerosomatales bacterium]